MSRLYRFLSISCLILAFLTTSITSNSSHASLAATEAPTMLTTSQSTQATTIVPVSGKWSSGKISFEVTGENAPSTLKKTKGDIEYRFTIADHGKSIKEGVINILIHDGILLSLGGPWSVSNIIDNSFSIQVREQLPAAGNIVFQYSWTGVFPSPTKVEGTATIEMISPITATIVEKFAWTATPELEQLTSAPTVAATMAPTMAAVSTQAAVIEPKSGNWSGETTQGKNISFTVKDNAIVFIEVSYTAEGCSGTASATGNSFKITNNQFGIGLPVGKEVGDEEYIFIGGKFDSNTSASGNLLGTGTTCTNLSTTNSTWKATLIATPEPTAAATMAPTMATTKAAASQKVSNGTYNLEVTKVDNTATWGTNTLKNSGDVFVIIHIETTDPGFDVGTCGALQDETGHLWKVAGADLGEDGRPAPVSTCVFVVPKGTSSLEWHPKGYPSIPLGF